MYKHFLAVFISFLFAGCGGVKNRMVERTGNGVHGIIKMAPS